MREVFGYEPGWPLVSPERRAEIEALAGRPAPDRQPGPEAGEHAGFPLAGESDAEHMDMRSARDRATGAG
jgi:hypothetical protein